MARLRAAGWPIVTSLPGRLSLLVAVAGATRAGPVIDLDYSDGLFAVSVFVQRGHLPGEMAGWSRIVIDGRHAFTDESGNHSIAWSAGGFVYTVLAVAPPRTVGQVVAALPHDSVAGFFARMREGLRQLLSWVSP
jgi:sigma-E factor negative regulatory protein RseB